MKGNKAFVMKTITSISTVLAYAPLVGYLISSASQVPKDHLIYSGYYIFLVFAAIFAAVLEFIFVWGTIKTKNGEPVELGPKKLIPTLIINIFIIVVAVLCWLSKLNML